MESQVELVEAVSTLAGVGGGVYLGEAVDVAGGVAAGVEEDAADGGRGAVPPVADGGGHDHVDGSGVVGSWQGGASPERHAVDGGG